MKFLGQLVSSDFMPHGTCYLWDPRIIWLHVISDSLITLSYYCIPIALVYLIRQRRDLPFNWIFWMFGLFILGCGTTHLMEVWNVWHSTYLLSGILKAITAAVSVVTAVMLIPLIPKAIALPSPAHLQAVNRELERQVNERKLVEARISKHLDLGLPAGNGYSVLKRLQESDTLSSIPVIVLTARDPQGNEERSLDAGAAAFFQKPADNNELLEVIRASLQSASPWGASLPS